MSSVTAPCPFCNLPKHRIVSATPLVLLVRDAFPLSNGHSLIIPRRHITSFFDLSADEQSDMLATLAAAKSNLDVTVKPDGYNFGVNDGLAAGQTVMHVHLHLIPRYYGQPEDPRGGIRWVLPEKAAYWS
jgi:diadenosine tetraphosphate (Ap4A) HIT family hydrolase